MNSLISIVLTVIAILFVTDISAQMSPHDAVARMKRGINMGNTLEPPYEDNWNNPPAEEIYFDLYQEAGFDVVRIPVRWHYHTDDDAPFAVDEPWMDRVEEVVDWGLSRGLFIVINAHHENWIKDDYANPVFRARFDSIWSQIAVRFQDKSDSLLFEIINEPHGLTQAQNDELHQRVLSIIRRTNPNRNVIIQGHNWGGSEELIAMAIPDDDHLIGSFHSYDPWPFGLEGTGSFGTAIQIQTLDNKFARVKEWSLQSNLPVFLGEFGCNVIADYNSRMKHYRAYVNLSLTYGFTFCVWDDGGNFRVMQRQVRSWSEVKDILIHCDPGSPTITGLFILNDTLVNIEWNNGSGGHDSISIQRRSASGVFTRIATLAADNISYVDPNAVPIHNNDYRIVAHHANNEVRHSNPLRIFMPEYVPKVRAFFLGEPHQIPGTIEAEDFDIGGEGLSYHDSDSRNIAGAYRPDEGVDIYDRNGEGFHIGNALPGEWYEYTVNVEKEGEYLVDVHCAAMETGGLFLIRIGEVASDTMEIQASYSWLDTKKTSFNMILPGGEQVMRFSVIGLPLFNIDKIDFKMNTTGLDPTAPGDQDLVAYQESGELVIHSTGMAPLQLVQVFHLSGAQVAILQVANPQEGDPVHRISTDGMKTGFYLIRAYSGDQVFTRKTFIQ